MWTQGQRDISNEICRTEGQRFDYTVEYCADDEWVKAHTTEDLHLELDEQLYLVVRTSPENTEKLRSRLYNRAYATDRSLRMKLVRSRRSKYAIFVVLNETKLFALADKEGDK